MPVSPGSHWPSKACGFAWANLSLSLPMDMPNWKSLPGNAVFENWSTNLIEMVVGLPATAVLRPSPFKLLFESAGVLEVRLKEVGEPMTSSPSMVMCVLKWPLNLLFQRS